MDAKFYAVLAFIFLFPFFIAVVATAATWQWQMSNHKWKMGNGSEQIIYCFQSL